MGNTIGRCESWSLSKGMCQCATWSPDGELLVFAETGTSSLWTLALHHIPPRIDGLLMKINWMSVYSGKLIGKAGYTTGKWPRMKARRVKKLVFMRNLLGLLIDEVNVWH